MQSLERQLVYLVVIIVVSVPILLEKALTPAGLVSATKLYDIVEKIPKGEDKIAFLALDFGPNTKAENLPQASVVIEHLLRRRIPFALTTLYAPGEGFLTTIPEDVVKRLEEENPNERYEYGVDWVNLGYKPGGSLFIQTVANSKDLVKELKKDVFGNPLIDLPAIRSIKTIEQVSLLAEFTGLVGTFDGYVQFFQKNGFVPTFGHGCTSITIPEAYIYLDSGQLDGLLEGLAGAAWYSKLLQDQYTKRAPDVALITNTALGVGHLVIMLLILLGNVKEFWNWRKNSQVAKGVS